MKRLEYSEKVPLRFSFVSVRRPVFLCFSIVFRTQFFFFLFCVSTFRVLHSTGGRVQPRHRPVGARLLPGAVRGVWLLFYVDPRGTNRPGPEVIDSII